MRIHPSVDSGGVLNFVIEADTTEDVALMRLFLDSGKKHRLIVKGSTYYSASTGGGVERDFLIGWVDPNTWGDDRGST